MWFSRNAGPGTGESAEDKARRELELKVEQVHLEAGEGYVESGPRSRSNRTASRRTVTRGPGAEFFQAKEFIPGQDEARTIMARASARFEDKIICKITRPETQVQVYVL